MGYLNVFPPDGRNSWEALDVLPIILTTNSGVTLVLGPSLWYSRGDTLAVRAVIPGLGVAALLLVLYRLVDPPGIAFNHVPFQGVPAAGVYTALVAASAIALGGAWAMMAETKRADDGRAVEPGLSPSS